VTITQSHEPMCRLLRHLWYASLPESNPSANQTICGSRRRTTAGIAMTRDAQRRCFFRDPTRCGLLVPKEVKFTHCGEFRERQKCALPLGKPEGLQLCARVPAARWSGAAGGRIRTAPPDETRGGRPRRRRRRRRRWRPPRRRRRRGRGTEPTGRLRVHRALYPQPVAQERWRRR